MSERLARLIPEAASAVPVTTFHALGYRIIREQAEALDLPPGVRVADDEEREALLKEKTGVSDSAARRLMRRISEPKCSDTALPEEADLFAAALREMKPSPFLRDIEERLLELSQTRAPRRVAAEQLEFL